MITVICECGGLRSARTGSGCHWRSTSASAATASSYVIASGHEFPEIESVVERARGYDVVRKQAPDGGRDRTGDRPA